MTARGRADGSQPPTAPAAHTIRILRAQDGAIELEHDACGGTWAVPVETVVPTTMLDVIHTVIDHQCAAPAAGALPQAA